MKTLIQSLAFVCLSLGLAGTGFSADGPNESKLAQRDKENAEWNHIVLQDGKAWVMKNGTKSELKEEVTLTDGTRVSPDGSYIEPKSTERKTLKDGEAITWEGKVKDHAKLMKKMENAREKAAEKAAETKSE